MQIYNHLLHVDNGKQYSLNLSPNQGGKLQHEYLVLHYTATPDASSAIKVLSNPSSKASAHIVIDRNGKITQLVPFDTIAWHAGKSIWQGHRGLNRYSIGVELENAGQLIKKNDYWTAWWGGKYNNKDVIEATHKNGGKVYGWHKYTEEQIEQAVKLSRLFIQEYEIKDILGHEDIAPGLKNDPGPAFPMAQFRASVLGPEFKNEPKEKLKETTKPLEIFFSYAHEDEEFRIALENHLSILKRKGFIKSWHDRNIKAGTNWSGEINNHLNTADIILFLVSSDFLASDYIWENEMKRALERHNRGEALVIPIILRPVDWQGAPFENLQMLPKDAKPVSLYKDNDEAFLDIAINIRDVVEKHSKGE